MTALLEQKEKLIRRRERYLEQHAEGLRPLQDVKERIADLDDQEAVVEKELEALRESERYLADLDRLANEFVQDLPYLLNSSPVIRDYETVSTERAEDNPLGIYTLTPDAIRHLPEEELAEKRRAAEDEQARRYRSAYENLELGVTAHRDGTLNLRWMCGESILTPKLLRKLSVSQTT